MISIEFLLWSYLSDIQTAAINEQSSKGNVNIRTGQYLLSSLSVKSDTADKNALIQFRR